MSTSDAKSLPAVGFMTVRDYPDLGLIGGYLILNTHGRPLEFHCTAPVRANRAQEILYGPTLEPFLYGEQIGQTLAAKGKHSPIFICTDVEQVLALRAFVSQPVVLLAEEEAGVARSQRVDGAHALAGGHLPRFDLGGHTAAVSTRFPEDRQLVVEHWSPHTGEFDLVEPFARLGEAIEETQGSARPQPAKDT